MFFRKNLFLLSSLLLIFIGAIPRAIEILSRNYLFGYDQGLFYEAVRDIVVERHLTLIGAEVGGIGGFFQGPGWYYLLSIPFVLFNGDPYGGMILMFLLGVVSLALSIFLFSKQLGRKTAFIIGILIAMSPGIIAQSRFIWPPFVIPPLSILLLYSVLQSYKDRKYFIPIAFFIIGLMSHFEIATAGTLLLPTIVSLLFTRPKGLFSFKVIFLSFGAFLTTQLTLVIFDMRHGFIATRGIFAFITHGSTLKSAYSFQNHLNMFKEAFLSVSYTWYIAYLLVILSVYSLMFMKKEKKKTNVVQLKFIKFLLISMITLFILVLPLKSTLWPWWFLEIPVYLCFLFGISLSYLLSKKTKIAVYVFFAIYSFMFISQTFKWYSYDFNDYGGTAKIKGKIQAIDFIYNDTKARDFGVLVFTPPVYTYPYDYLFEWYAQNRYMYNPPKEKRQTFYLLIEPDPEKQWSYRGWLETVIKDGKVEKTTKLPSGFIIQKRTLNSL